MQGRVAFILKGYPRLSETFIAQEIAALERRGLDILIYSLRQPTDARRHAVHDEIRARVAYLPEYLLLEPLRVMRAWLRERKNPRYKATRNLWLRDLLRDPTPNRIRRFGQALVLANELPQDVKHLHAHFLHTPASVTRYAVPRMRRTSGPPRNGKSARSWRLAHGSLPALRRIWRTLKRLRRRAGWNWSTTGLIFRAFPSAERAMSKETARKRRTP